MLEWIVSSTLLILVVAALRAALKGRISPRLQYALWLPVLLRLLIPVSFGSSQVSVNNLVRVASGTETGQAITSFSQAELPRMTYSAAYSEVSREYEERGVDISALPSAEREAADREVLSRMNGGLTVREMLTVVWAAGAAAVGCAFVFSNLRFYACLRRSRKKLGTRGTLDVYVSGAVETPCLFGLVLPSIYVTPEAAENAAAMRHVTEHELTHFRHGDNVWSLLRGVCLALHWYNPFVWCAALLSCRDSELACDEAAIKRLGESERADYGRTLIGMTCRKRPNLFGFATTMTGSGRSIKERVIFIAKKPRTTVLALIAVLIVAAVAAGCTFTGAKEPAEDALAVFDFSLYDRLARSTYDDIVEELGLSGDEAELDMGGLFIDSVEYRGREFGEWLNFMSKLSGSDFPDEAVPTLNNIAYNYFLPEGSEDEAKEVVAELYNDLTKKYGSPVIQDTVAKMLAGDDVDFCGAGWAFPDNPYYTLSLVGEFGQGGCTVRLSCTPGPMAFIAGAEDPETAEITVDESGVPYIRYSPEEEWVRLGEPIAPPKEWATDVDGGGEGLAGRNEASALFVYPDTTELWARLVSQTDGWLVACCPRGVSSADTYVYKTEDGGVTWIETARPEEGWLVGAVGFINPERLIVAKRLFDGAPCFITKDSGGTWDEIPLPGENLQVRSITVDGSTVSMEVGPSEASPEWYVMTSRDLGDTWETAEVTVSDYASLGPMVDYAEQRASDAESVTVSYFREDGKLTETVRDTVADARAVGLQKLGELDGLAPDGTLELWEWYLEIKPTNAGGREIAPIGGEYVTEDGYLGEGSGVFTIALQRDDGGFEVLAEPEPVFFGMYRYTVEESLYDWYVTEYGMDELPLYVEDWADRLTFPEGGGFGSFPAHRYDGDGWYIYIPVEAWTPAEADGSEAAWESEYGTGSTVSVSRSENSVEDEEKQLLEQGFESSDGGVYERDADGVHESCRLFSAGSGCLCVRTVWTEDGVTEYPYIAIEPEVLRLISESFAAQVYSF